MKTISTGFFIVRLEPENYRRLLIGLAMVLAAGLAVLMTPDTKIAAKARYFDLEQIIPKQFGQWRKDERIVPVQANPEVQAKLDKIYNQVLSRTYIHKNGERIMLSIAYGGDQRDSMQVHLPSVCYPSQGFSLLEQSDSVIDTGFNQVPVSRMVAQKGMRIEPVTYWIVIGDKVPATGLARKIEQVKYGLTGRVPDGLLFRVSHIQGSKDIDYSLHARFINDLVRALRPEDRTRIIGR